MRAWRVHKYGQPKDALQLDEVPLPEPGPGQVRVRVHAIPLNLNDVERVTGLNMMVRPDLPCTPGMEVMGVVDACGESTDSWRDRRIVALPQNAFGGFAEYAICPVIGAFAMPEEIPLPGAAALYFPFHLAWLGLHDRAKLQTGESVLIHAAAGGAGSAAIQLAKNKGARVFATASSEAKLEFCRELGADVVINYEKTDFSEVILDETEGRGVNVIFDNVGERFMQKSMRSIAYDGRYLIMGFSSDKSFVDEKLIVPRSVSAGNFSVGGVMLAYVEEAMAPLIKRGPGWNFVPSEKGDMIMRKINQLAIDKKIRPVVGRVADFKELPGALDDLSKRRTMGRTIIKLW
jgi:NADPH2:quinone reductase